MRGIIPAAGYGLRMKMKPNQSKEMLYDPSIDAPIIEYALAQCEANNIKPLIITREDKKDLIKYCEHRADIQIFKPIVRYGKERYSEWPTTVLSSRKYWQKENVLILPDTRWSFLGDGNILAHMQYLLEYDEFVIAKHKVKDISKWGAFEGRLTAEKPNFKIAGLAWGLIAWRNNEEAQKLFENYVNPGQWRLIEHVSYAYLNKFEDITRNGRRRLNGKTNKY